MWPFGSSLSYSQSICHHWHGGHALGMFLCSLVLTLLQPCFICLFSILTLWELGSHYFSYIVNRVYVSGKFKFCAILKKKSRLLVTVEKLDGVVALGPSFPKIFQGEASKRLLCILHSPRWVRSSSWSWGVICLVKETYFFSFLFTVKPRKMKKKNDNILDWREYRKLEPCTSFHTSYHS